MHVTSMATTTILAASLAAGLAGPGATAEEMKASGTIHYDPPELVEMKAGGEGANTIRLPGGTLDEENIAAIDGNEHACFGTMKQVTQGRPPVGTGYCVQTDADGDVWWITWTGQPGDTEWTVTGGTGKFEGATGKGRTRLVEQKGDGSSVIRYEGTLDLK